MSQDSIKLPSQLARDLFGAAIELRQDNGATRLTFSLSSEAPVERMWGTEVLSHAPGAVQMARIDGGAAPLLFNHDWNDPIGMITAGRVQDGRLVVDAQLFDTARAKEVAAMMAGGLRNVSIGYEINTLSEDAKSATYTATRWTPLEGSIVTIPADPSVGIGRTAAETEFKQVQVIRAIPTPAALPAATTQEATIMAETQNASAGDTANITVTDNGAQAERLRVTAIDNLCRDYNVSVEQRDAWRNQGVSIGEATRLTLQMLAERTSADNATTKIGLSKKEVQNYSLLRAIRAASDKNWGKAGFELEVHNALMTKLGRGTSGENGFFVPLEVQQRDMTVGTVAAGGYLVGTQNQSFIELLRNRSVVMAMGATQLNGMQGNVTIPKQTAAGTGYWLNDEGTAITESGQTIGQLSLSPKNVGAYTEISRQLMIQSSPDAEALVMNDLARVVAIAADLAAISGSGSSGQPHGIVGTSGIGSVSGTSLAYAGILEFQSDVATSNALNGSFGYVTTPVVAALLMARFTNATYGENALWDGNLLDANMAGFKAMSSGQMATATMLAGSWDSLVLASWGVLEIDTNPYADFTKGITGVRAFYSMDVGVRYAAAFSYASSIT